MKFNLSEKLNYGILLSGGLDSAILLGLMLIELPTIKIQPFTIPKTDGAAQYITPIIEFFNQRHSISIPETIHVGDIRVHHRLQSKTAVEEIFSKYHVNFLFNGLNQNPPALATHEHAPKRDTKSTNPRLILPFINMFKDSVLKLMYDNGLDELVDMTHSCTERKNNRCRSCWQCMERQWAFDEIGKEDTGKL